MKTEEQTIAALDEYGHMVRRICFLQLKNHADVEDIFQEVFIKYMSKSPEFENPEHEKAWIIRVSVNACKDLLKSFFRKKVTSVDQMEYEPYAFDDHERTVLDAVMDLKPDYRNVIYMNYYEGYSAVEISKIMNKNENTIYTWLSRARGELKTALGGELYEGL